MTPPPDGQVRGMSPLPFPLHMMLAMSALLSSKSGLPHWSAAWPQSNPGALNLPPPLKLPESLTAQLAELDPGEFERALDQQVVAAGAEFAQGIEAYRRHGYRRADETAPAIWRLGASTLLDHGAAQTGGRGNSNDVSVLFVPSLINRGWILDLVPGRGMLSWLAGQGVHPYRIEWGAPGLEECPLSVADYVISRLEPALDEVLRRSGRPVILAGYCMGGLLALAAAIRRPDAISGLALLATPWDFHAAGADRAAAIAAVYRSCRPFLGAWGEFPIDAIQALFAMHDPIVALRKFRRFAALPPDSTEAQAFVAMEDWLNDGVALSLPVADEALLGWYGDNITGRGMWQVGGAAIDPAALPMPTLVVVPGTDRIVPPASAAALLPKLQQGQRLDVPLGHIGMVAGRRAEQALWRPLGEWIKEIGGRA